MNKEILKNASNIEEKLIKIRRQLHENAEVGHDIPKTREFVKRLLKEYGYTTINCGKSGIVASVGHGKRTLLLRADMDALPIKEESGLPFSCENGNMHACGHDIHTAMLLGAAIILKKYERDLKCTVKLMFQGAEEILSGASDMIENGVLDDPKTDNAFMLHTVVGVDMEVGDIIVPPSGVIAPAADFFEIVFKGRSSHGADPERGVDALAVAAEVLLHLNNISRSREDVVISVGKLEGGRAANVIADLARIEGTFRCMDDRKQKQLRNEIKEESYRIAKSKGAEPVFKIKSDCPSLVNDVLFRDFAIKCAAELYDGEKIHLSEARGGGSEDFAFVSRRVPSVMLAIAAGGARDGCSFPAHNPKTRYSEAVIKYGAAVYASIALDYE